MSIRRSSQCLRHIDNLLAQLCSRRAHLVALVVSAMLTNGCVMLPIPWPASKAHVTEEQTAALEPTVVNRDAVRAALGDADLRRDHDRLWIYGSYEKQGKLVVLGPTFGGMGPLQSSHHVLFLEFDDRGVLASSAWGQSAGKGEERDVFCTEAQLCIEGWHRESVASGLFVYDEKEWLDDANTAVFRKGDPPAQTPVPPDACRLVAIADEEWMNEIKSWYLRTGFLFRLDVGWSGFVYLPRSTVAMIDLDPGRHHLSAPYVSYQDFDCPPGQTVAVRLGYAYKYKKVWFLGLQPDYGSPPIQIKATPLDESELAAALGRPRLILPDIQPLPEAKH
jgi:hypothetical protein